MHVISRKKLVDFWRKHPQAKGPLIFWFKIAKRSKWRTFAEVRQGWGSADQVRKYVVFDIGGNKYRLIAVIHYNRQKLFIRYVLTHGEYDKEDWKFD